MPSAEKPRLLGDMRLAGLAMAVAQVVAAHGPIPEDQLVDAFRRSTGVEVPRNLERLLTKFAWSAKGHGFVDIGSDDGTWRMGTKMPREISQFGEWTFNVVVARARVLLSSQPEQDAFEQLVRESTSPAGGRVPRLPMTVAGTAIHATRALACGSLGIPAAQARPRGAAYSGAHSSPTETMLKGHVPRRDGGRSW